MPTSNLPSNFLDCLRRVTPLTGMLTFERFLAGVRFSIHESQTSMSHTANIWNQQQTINYRLHRVRSEGKLQEICHDINNEHYDTLNNATNKK